MNQTAEVRMKITSTVPPMSPSELTVSQARAIAIMANGDHRGDLTVLFHALGHRIVAGIDFNVRQIMCSRSRAGVLRGMHSQARQPQAKLVTCVQGRILDVIYDCRPGSPTLGAHDVVLLESPEHAVYVPPGCLHGYYAFEESTVVYAVDQLYDPASDGGVHWATLGIPWPDKDPICSDKDLRLGTLTEWRAKCTLWAGRSSDGRPGEA